MENNLIISQSNLPTNIEDLSKFVLVGREKLVAVRAEIRAIQKIGLAEDVRKQKLHEAQEINDAVLDAEMRLGELMAKVPKASGGDRRSENFKNDSGVVFEKSKTDIIKDAGFTPKQVQRFQTLAEHPDIVEQVKAEARANDDIASRSDILKRVKEQNEETLREAKNQEQRESDMQHRPHVTNNSGCNEWYTPKKYIDLVKQVLGEIDLDPASCEYANKTVEAKQYYSLDDDGLLHSWKGKVFMNPPYHKEYITPFINKFVSEYTDGNIQEAITLTNNATETEWFNKLVAISTAVVFPSKRIRYDSDSRTTNSPIQGQVFLYFGNNKERFLKVFSEIGWGAIIYHE